MESPCQPIEERQKSDGLLISIVPGPFEQRSDDDVNSVRALPQSAEYITLQEHIDQYITHHIGLV